MAGQSRGQVMDKIRNHKQKNVPPDGRHLLKYKVPMITYLPGFDIHLHTLEFWNAGISALL